MIATCARTSGAQDVSISGTITVAPAAKGKLPKELLLIISVSKTPDPKKAPIAVKRVPAPEFPYRYTLGEEDITLDGSRLEGKLYVTARVEPGDGSATPSGPLEGVYPRNPVSVGAKGVDIAITASVPPLTAEAPANPLKPRDAGMVRVGLLWSGSTPFGSSSVPEELRLAFRDLGYVDDRNIAFEARYAEGRYDRLPELAASLVDLKVDVILAAGDSAAILAAKHATGKVPIVMMALADTVQLGLVPSLARPAGNLTGLSFPLAAIAGKQLELLKKAIPSLRRVGVLWNPSNPATPRFWRSSPRPRSGWSSSFSSSRSGGPKISRWRWRRSSGRGPMVCSCSGIRCSTLTGAGSRCSRCATTCRRFPRTGSSRRRPGS